MADFIAHHLLGKQVLSVFPVPAQRSAVQHPASFYWGCQGPDILFYRKILTGSPLHKLGNRLHSEKTDELFFALVRAVSCLTGDEREIAQAYFYGFVCHYALDCEIHPYVYCRQEQLRSADEKMMASAIHSQIESDIDALLYQKAAGASATTFDPDEYYKLTDTELATLAAVLHAVILRVYGQNVPTHDLRRSFQEMLAWENFLYSDSRMVYRGAQRIERLIGRGALLTGHMKVETPAWDALNLEHDPWRNLWRPEEIRTESVIDLFGVARVRAASLAGQYAAQLDSGWLLRQKFETAFDNGNPKRLGEQRG